MSLQFLYSGVQSPNTFQYNSDKSLGGYISSSPVTNNTLNELFSDISLLGEQNQYIEVKGIFLKNIGTVKTNLRCWFVTPQNNKALFEIAAVIPVNSNQIEVVQTFRTNPQIGTFFNPDVNNKALLSSSLAANDTLGLWLRRTIQPKQTMTLEQLETYQANQFLVKTEQFDLIFSWD